MSKEFFFLSFFFIDTIDLYYARSAIAYSNEIFQGRVSTCFWGDKTYSRYRELQPSLPRHSLPSVSTF